MEQPRFRYAGSIRNGIDRARLRQANRLCAQGGRLTKQALMTIKAEDIRASRISTTGRRTHPSEQINSRVVEDSPG
ncbi:MAG: hypothetical protein M0Z53_13335 [Thermaerobacter sp.]|nr:hypothetical protein [Thermaerobacter sp.]